MLPPKWCSYCRKTDHDDSECSCTRPADWKPGRQMVDPSLIGSRPVDWKPPADWKPLADWKRA